LLNSAHTASRPFLVLRLPHQRAGWGCTRSWEGTQLGQLTPAGQRYIPHHMTSCSAIKAGGRRRKGGRLQLRCLAFQITVARDGGLLSWGLLNTCLSMGSSEWIPYSALFAHAALIHLLNCLYLNQQVLSVLPFFSPPSHWEWSDRVVVWGLTAYQG